MRIRKWRHLPLYIGDAPQVVRRHLRSELLDIPHAIVPNRFGRLEVV